MKKRILAFALVCIMVVSMLPTSILAADTTTKCPGAKVAHTTENCTYDKVTEVAPVPTACKDGYTIYKCTGDCQEEFTVINPAPHNYGAGTVVAPTCADGDAGKGYTKSICSICGDVKKDTWVDRNEHNYNVFVKFNENEEPVYKCATCDKTAVKSHIATDKGYDETNHEHDWADVVPTINTIPTKNTDGSATFVCPKEECKYTETQVLVWHAHTADGLKKVEAKAATCTADGYTQTYYVCQTEGCGLIFLSLADAAEWKNAQPANFETTNTIAALKHTFDREGATEPDTRDPKPMICKEGEQQDASIEKKCTDANCPVGTGENKGWVRVVTQTAAHAPVQGTTTGATCFAPGTDFGKTCANCGEIITAASNVLWADPDNTHKTNEELAFTDTQIAAFTSKGYAWSQLKNYITYTCWEYVEKADVDKDGVDEVSTPPTCEDAGRIVVKCTVCAATATDGQHYRKIELPALGHNKQTVTVAATCSTPGFTYQYCADHDDNTKLGDCALNDGTITDGKITVAGKAIALAWTTKTEGSKITYTEVTEAPAHGSKYITSSIVVGTTDSTKHLLDWDITQAPTCTQPGAHFQSCHLCSDYPLTPVEDPALQHNYTYTDAVVEYSLSADGVAFTWSTTKIDNASCVASLYTRVRCERYSACNACSEPTLVEAKHPYTATKIYTLAEAQKYHGASNLAKGENINPATCTKNAQDKYSCSVCNNVIIVETEATGYHKGFEGDNAKAAFDAYKTNGTGTPAKIDFTKTVPATCTTDAYKPIMYCVYCDEARTARDTSTGSKTGHNFSASGENDAFVITEGGVKYEYTPATAKEDGRYEIRVCNNDNCGDSNTYYQVRKSGADGAVEVVKFGTAPNQKDYTTDMAAAIAAAKIPAWHSIAANWNSKVNEDPATCYEPGTNAYYTCKCCPGTKWNGNTVTATAYTDETIVIEQLKHTYAAVTGAGRKADCANFGYQLYNCTRDNCDAQYINAYVAPLSATGAHTPSEDQPAGYEDIRLECNQDAVDYKKCTVCDAVYSVVTEAPGVHKNKDDKVISTSCATKDIEDRECVLCKANGQSYEYEYAHDASFSEKQTTGATCGKNEVNFWLCDVCGETKAEEVPGTMKDHDFTNMTAVVVNPTAEAAGKVECFYKCGATVDISGIGFSLEVANATKAGALYTDATNVTLTVSITGLPSATLQAIQFTVKHDEAFVFNGAKALTNSGFVVADAAAEDKETVNVFAMGADEITVTDGVAVIELSFTISTSVAGTYNFAVVNTAEKPVTVASDANTLYWINTAATASVEVVKFMDATGDNKVDALDAVALYNTYTADATAYDSSLDLDRDGKLTAKDLELLIKFIVSGAGVDSEEYNALVGRS